MSVEPISDERLAALNRLYDLWVKATCANDKEWKLFAGQEYKTLLGNEGSAILARICQQDERNAELVKQLEEADDQADIVL